MEIIKIGLSNQKLAKYYTNRVQKPQSRSAMSHECTPKVESFLELLQTKIEVKNTDRVYVDEISACSAGKPMSISSFTITKTKKVIWKLEVEGMQSLDFMYNEANDCIELWWLESSESGTGIGSTCMDAILDCIDEMNEKLYLTPVPFNSNVSDNPRAREKAFHNLRNWYQSTFDFVTLKKDPSLLYIAQ